MFKKVWRFQPFLLQVLGKPLPVQDDQLVQHLVPVPVTLCPFSDYIPTGKIQHLFQCTVTWEYAFCLCHFPVLAVEAFYDICGVHDTPDIIRKLEERTHVFLIIFPAAYCIGIFPSPFFFDLFQF